VAALPAHSFLLDGEAIVTNAKGLAVFDLIRHMRHDADAALIAFIRSDRPGRICAVSTVSASWQS
jgi:ATP-dependent DNA ligase